VITGARSGGGEQARGDTRPIDACNETLATALPAQPARRRGAAR